VKIKTLYTYCKQDDRRGKDYETKLFTFCDFREISGGGGGDKYLKNYSGNKF
jgi:hypothetical protein